MNVCGVIFGGYLTKILSFKTGNLLNNSKFHLLSEGTVQLQLLRLGFHHCVPYLEDVDGAQGCDG